jgi:hypothetical protein
VRVDARFGSQIPAVRCRWCGSALSLRYVSEVGRFECSRRVVCRWRVHARRQLHGTAETCAVCCNWDTWTAWKEQSWQA